MLSDLHTRGTKICNSGEPGKNLEKSLPSTASKIGASFKGKDLLSERSHKFFPLRAAPMLKMYDRGFIANTVGSRYHEFQGTHWNTFPDIRTSTYQSWESEENNKLNNYI